jgi:porphobilinogen deaminase
MINKTSEQEGHRERNLILQLMGCCLTALAVSGVYDKEQTEKTHNMVGYFSSMIIKHQDTTYQSLHIQYAAKLLLSVIRSIISITSDL